MSQEAPAKSARKHGKSRFAIMQNDLPEDPPSVRNSIVIDLGGDDPMNILG